MSPLNALTLSVPGAAPASEGAWQAAGPWAAGKHYCTGGAPAAPAPSHAGAPVPTNYSGGDSAIAA